MRALNDFFTMFETQTSHKARVLHVDGGREFINQLTDAELLARGIVLEVTAPDTPAQNGPAERAGAIIVEATRCMMDSSGIPYRLWLYAIRTATTIINLLPTSSNDGSKSPHECLAAHIKLGGTKPYIHHLRTFGCVAYVHKKGSLRPAKSAKMQPRALKGKLVGYDSLRGHIFHVWIPQLDCVLRVRDVRFWEGLDSRPDDHKEPEYEAVFEDPILIETPFPTTEPLVPSTQEEEHAEVTQERQTRVSFDPVPVIIEEAPPTAQQLTPKPSPAPEELDIALGELDVDLVQSPHPEYTNSGSEQSF
ncbi:hypothetical protein IMZ48_27960 [Candidatus Bathyarchaeota archaeon]|nr:hypothetical protein [Candidatus Bathyarchaeota archaeon]